ncbi:hypothetical protein Pgy4_36807, partial [Pseudomonas savastanoi pv. glycinea str. race 4]
QAVRRFLRASGFDYIQQSDRQGLTPRIELAKRLSMGDVNTRQFAALPAFQSQISSYDSIRRL